MVVPLANHADKLVAHLAGGFWGQSRTAMRPAREGCVEVTVRTNVGTDGDRPYYVVTLPVGKNVYAGVCPAELLLRHLITPTAESPLVSRVDKIRRQQ